MLKGLYFCCDDKKDLPGLFQEKIKLQALKDCVRVFYVVKHLFFNQALYVLLMRKWRGICSFIAKIIE